ncbi:Ku protein [Mycobacterium spongiae]|uniref:Ku domain-containing protein n=1 Tax=Mycobacterium spongiae TaxID=886343 RepID=A0A975PYF1_9MYCO|nr:Ku protein [Mycobacterium spongiae]QUR68804.1 hypothetical protein F6B93_18510 [Mycobacterium spongiae]
MKFTVATLPGEPSHEIEALGFVPAGDLDPMMFDRSCVESDSKSSTSLRLLVTTLAGSDRMAIAHVTLPSTTRLGALRVKDFGERDLIGVRPMTSPSATGMSPEQPEGLIDAKLEGGAAFTPGEKPAELGDTEDVSDPARGEIGRQVARTAARSHVGSRWRPRVCRGVS